MLGLGNHGDDDVDVLSQLQRRSGGLGADGGQLLDLSLDKVEDINLVVVLLNDVLAHGLAHDAQSDETDFHVAYILSGNVSKMRDLDYSVTVLSQALRKMPRPWLV